MQATIVDQLAAISSLMQEDMRRAFAGTTLTETRVHALWVLVHLGPATQQQLSDALGVTPRSVSALVDGLVGSGYAERAPHPEDGRAVLVTLTERASAMMRRMREDHRRLSEHLESAVDESDRAAFERGMAAVLARLEHLVRHEEVSYGDVETP